MLINSLHHLNETWAVQEVPECAEGWLEMDELVDLVLAACGFEHLACLLHHIDCEDMVERLLLLLDAVGLEPLQVPPLLTGCFGAPSPERAAHDGVLPPAQRPAELLQAPPLVLNVGVVLLEGNSLRVLQAWNQQSVHEEVPQLAKLAALTQDSVASNVVLEGLDGKDVEIDLHLPIENLAEELAAGQVVPVSCVAPSRRVVRILLMATS